MGLAMVSILLGCSKREDEPAKAAPGAAASVFEAAEEAAAAIDSADKRASGSISLVDQIVNELPWGNIAFNAPEAMRFGRPRRIELLLSPTNTTGDLQAQLQQKLDAKYAEIKV